jgi:protoporphyrinogen IX oxidase
VFDFLMPLYPWTKSLHIVSFVAWMAGLFYLPRLFVYHAETASAGGEMSETFKIMERRLLRAIMNPAMIATWFFGAMLLLTPGAVLWSQDIWIYPKLGLVAFLTWFHHWCGLRRKEFAVDENTRTGKTYRIMNEAPTLALLAIVILAIVKPF